MKYFALFFVSLFLISCASKRVQNLPETPGKILRFERNAIADTTTVLIKGKVTNLNDSLVSNALVKLTGNPKTYFTTTDEAGNFIFSKIVAGRYLVEISSLGYNKLDTSAMFGTGDRWQWHFALSEWSRAKTRKMKF